GTITNDDTATLTRSEERRVGKENMVFQVVLSADVQSGVTVNYATANGSATVTDSDYTAASGTVTFAGNANETQSITVSTTSDTKVEDNETLTVSLSGVSASTAVQTAAIGTSGSPATGTITNDDTATLT